MCARQEFGRGVMSGEVGDGIEVLVVERTERLTFSDLMRTADVDHDAVLVERLGGESARR